MEAHTEHTHTHIQRGKIRSNEIRETHAAFPSSMCVNASERVSSHGVREHSSASFHRLLGNMWSRAFIVISRRFAQHDTHVVGT